MSIDGATGQELDTALGTVVRFSRGGVTFTVLGSVPAVAADAARALAARHDERWPRGSSGRRGRAPPPVEVRGLVKRYGQLTAVAGVDLTVHAGDVYGYLGPTAPARRPRCE